MKKIRGAKRGFTLVEMVLVIAIIVILASVLFFSVSSYVDKAKLAKSKVQTHNDVIFSATAEIDSVLLITS